MARPRSSASGRRAPGPADFGPTPLEPAEQALASRLLEVLPEGYRIIRTARNVVPDEWISDSASGFLIEGRSDAHTFWIWFLPRDWIGIRKPDPQRPRPNYWEGILSDAQHTTITLSTDTRIPEMIHKLGMSTPSIVNSGWTEAARVFQGRFEKAEAEAERLIAAHCPNSVARDEAAYSLVVLGIPAASVFRRAAREGSGDAQQLSISALSHFPGKATVDAVKAVLEDPATPELARGYAGQVAGDLGAKELGPALITALGLAKEIDTTDRIILGIGDLRHEPAGPRVLQVMEATGNPYYKARFAGVLARLRHLPAEKAIRALAEGPFPKGDWKFSASEEEDVRKKARLALLVLTGNWGQPVNGLRFLVEGPKTASAGGPIWAVLRVENVGDTTASWFVAASGRFVVDGVAHSRRMAPMDGADSLYPGAIWDSREDLASFLRTPGIHRVQYEIGSATSNTITIDVSAAAKAP